MFTLSTVHALVHVHVRVRACVYPCEKVRVGYCQKLFLKIIQKDGNLKQIIKRQNILHFQKAIKMKNTTLQ